MYFCIKENIMYYFEIVIVDLNIFICLGLKNILEDIILMVIICVFYFFGELMDDILDMYVYYFIFV